ncbi:hypothetical protein GKA01_26540 [Gluconobacter kanchanaburiensis NBRC 103587]|uniref:Uncharacterized protein n=1 Tax=Gluconobacter kanchanaburiensis NBRC 103587 TaxID=1307948 RepID=A0A511BI24_9PROT|nr:hypothetical protein GKA01_26540 [Gluconobacter kanchanaburiensis NBRC 103587]
MITFQKAAFAVIASFSEGLNVSSGKGLVAAGSRVAGSIQESISLSNTESVPIQKIANRMLPSTTPAQVCIQPIERLKF